MALYRRVRLILLPSLAFCLAATTAKSEETSIPPIGPILRELREKHSLPGLAAAIVRGDKVEAAAIGVRSAGGDDTIQIDDRFHIASCTKSMTAMLAAMLVEEGKLRWDTSVGDRLPELNGKVRVEYLSVRLDQLLAHTGGLPAYTNFGQERLEELLAIPGTNTAQRLTFVTQVLAEPPVASPGSQAEYSNAGYALAAAMIERAAGTSWEELIRERVFRPLQMESAGFGWPATMADPRQPRGHRSDDEGKTYVPQPLDDAYRLPPCLWPAGAVHCSIGDLADYVRVHLNGLRGQGQLLKPETYQKLHAPPEGKIGGLTLGWGTGVDATFGRIHYGAGSGGTFFVRIWIAPESNLAVVVATNCGNAAAAQEVVGRLAHHVGWRGPE